MREGKGDRMKRFVGLWLIVFGVFLFGMVLGRWTGSGDFPQLLEATNKTEQGGKYFIEVSMEVSPEEYIGLDIGDTFEGSLKCYF